MIRKSTIALLLTLTIFANAKPYWPAFHGPERTNLSSETGLLSNWPEGGPDLEWTATGIGKGYSSVDVVADRIYTAGMVNDVTCVTALTGDGKIIWQEPAGKSWHASEQQPWAVAYDGARATPTVDDGVVYFMSEMGILTAFNAMDGKVIWSQDLVKTYNARIPNYGFSESVLVMGNRLFCCPAGDLAYAVALDKRNGHQIWSLGGIIDNAGNSSFVPAIIEDVPHIINLTAERIFAVNPDDGKLLWDYPFASSHLNNATDVIVRNGYVFASTGNGGGCVLVKPERGLDGTFSVKKVWGSDLMDNHHGGVVLVNDYLYGSGHEARGWFCLDFKTGAQAWNHKKGKGSLTYAEENLYCLDEHGDMSLVRAIPDSFSLISSFKAPKGGRGAFWAHPVVAGGHLYVRHADHLYAYRIK